MKDAVRERALELAIAGRDDEQAVSEVLEAAAGRRVAVVMARQELDQVPDALDPETLTRAASLLDRALEAGTWHDVAPE